MSHKVEALAGIGSFLVQALQSAGICTTDGLLLRCSTHERHQAVSEMTGIPAGQLNGWVNTAKLMNVPGVGWRWAGLLEAAGISTVEDLSRENAGILARKIALINRQKKLTTGLPPASAVAAWIEESKRSELAAAY